MVYYEAASSGTASIWVMFKKCVLEGTKQRVLKKLDLCACIVFLFIIYLSRG